MITGDKQSSASPHGTLVVMMCFSIIGESVANTVCQTSPAVPAPTSNIAARRTSLPESTLRSLTRPWFCFTCILLAGGNSDFRICYSVFQRPPHRVHCVCFCF